MGIESTVKLSGRFLAAMMIVSLAAAFRLFALGNSDPYITFYPAVITTSLLCGFFPGLLAMALSALMADYWWIEPVGSLAIAADSDLISICIFIFNSTFICCISELMLRARRRASLLETESGIDRERRSAIDAMLKQQVILERMSQLAKVGGWCFDVETMRGERTAEAALIHDSEETTRIDVLEEIDRYQGESKEKIALAIKEAIELGRPYELDLELFTANGVHKWVRTHGYPVKRDGKVVRIEGADQDITESKLAETALKESERRYTALFENMREGLALCRMHYDGGGEAVDFEYLTVNSSYSRQTKLTDVTGRTASQVIPGALRSNPQLLEIYGRVAAGGQPEKFETYVPDLDQWFSVSVCSPGEGLFITIIDTITDMKLAEFTKEATLELLKLCNAAKNIHELREDLIQFFTRSSYCDDLALRLCPEDNCICTETTGGAYISYGCDGFEASAVIPLIHQNEILGIVQLNYNDNSDLSLTQIREFENLASYSAIALAKLRADKSLQESNIFYRQIIDNLGEGIVVHDCNLRYSLWNRFMEDVSGIGSQDVIGRHPQEVFPYFQGISVLDRIRQALKGSPPTAIELPYNFERSGCSGWFLDKSLLMKDNAGNVTGVINILHDITEQRMVEEALENVKNFTENAINNLRDTFLVLDLEGRIIKWNIALSATTGYSDVEIAGLTHADLTSAEYLPQQQETMKKILHQGSASMEGVLLTRDGRKIPYEYTGARLCDSSGEIIGLSITGRDITERKAMEKQLFHSQKMEAIGTLAGGIAHDFNNLLTVISGYGTLLQMKIPETDLMRGELDQILAASEKAAFLVNRLLTFSRKLEINPSNVNLADLVRNLDKFLARIIGEDIQLTVTTLDDDLFVKADMNQIEQILMNLATNARDAMPNGGQLSIELCRVEFNDAYVRKQGYGRIGSYALISVKDSGHGIDNKTQQHIFEPYFTTKELGKGTGLGLSIVYGIVKQHGGYINVESAEGFGTTFRIFIPLQEQSSIPEHKIESDLQAGQETILLAEDEEVVRKILLMMLSSVGYKVMEASSGRDAIEVFNAHRNNIDLLLFDIVMPDMNGIAAYKEISRVYPGMKVIFMSGYPADVIVNKADLPPGTEIIAKPIQRHELAHKISQLLANNGPSTQNRPPAEEKIWT